MKIYRHLGKCSYKTQKHLFYIKAVFFTYLKLGSIMKQVLFSLNSEIIVCAVHQRLHA